MPTFTRFVEVGRIIYIDYGDDAGKLATIIDIVDQNKALIEGPEEITGVARQVISFRRVKLTDFKVSICRNARAKTLKKAWTDADILKKWGETNWAKKIERKRKRESLNDFERFNVMIAKKKKAHIISKHMKQLEA
eukprot:CAMPEP_0172481836 /NCGR_PEP_ID=MMETSP1066-20121228/7979_1 /TAXON_ID=671091 /ORGANISM="Coscinodiscus wailesii, Strain CCMP2513" /LENGTH=135 /DNA_ID=CAMNT_0013244487 /DNA_START=148 /DNA_END=555 /DNA_ORIENTATION=+